MSSRIQRIKRAARKNVPELLALSTGTMPSFVYGRRAFKDIPIFCFHSAHWPEFKHQLEFLDRNGYRTLSADELLERTSDPAYENDGTEIALTFDDGMASVWAVAFPLLKKHGAKIISFILPGLIEDGADPGLTIEDADDREKRLLAERDFSRAPLCNWREIELMHQSGLVDFQSHGMYHALVATSDEIVDFIHPHFDLYHYGDIHVPIYHDGTSDNVRTPVLGHPVYASDTRFSGRRYYDPVAVRNACADLVRRNGSEHFFINADWRQRLHRQARSADTSAGAFETDAESEAAMRAELQAARDEIERRLDKQVRHFCFPWFRASDLATRLALECGHESIYLGALRSRKHRRDALYPVTFTRLQEEYLYCLPGEGSRSLVATWRSKLSHREAVLQS